MDRNTFTKQRDINPSKSRAVELLQLLQELKEREMTAQQHNRQLLQQFEEAQHTLREMLTLTHTMKTIRMEYERYLEESSPFWQQQLKEKTQAPPKKRMEEILKPCLKTSKVTKSPVDELLLSQGLTLKPQKITAPQKHYRQNSHLDDNQDGSPHLPYMQSPHPQSQKAGLPIRFPFEAQGSPHIPPSFLPPPIFSHESQLHHLPSMPGHHHLWPKQNPPGRASSQPDYRWSGTAAAAGIPSGSEGLWGQLYVVEPSPEREVAQVVGEEAERDTTPSLNREREDVSRSSNLSQELDVKPVRLPYCPAESSESSRESSQGSREKRKKRGRLLCTSSNQERHSSQETSSAKVSPAVTVVQSSESDVSSEKGKSRRRRSAGLAVGSPRAEKVANNREGHKEESRSASEESRREKAEDRSSDKSESCTEESGSQQEEEPESVSEDTETGGEMSNSSEESSVAEKDEDEHEKDLGEGNEEDDGDKNKENQRVGEQEERDDDVSENQETTEEEETGPEEDMEEESEEEGDKEETSVMLEDEEDGKWVSAFTHDEEDDKDDSEGGENKMEDGESDKEEEGEGVEREEQRRDEAEEPEERDSEDSIISPQNKSIKMHIIPEEAREDEEGSQTGSSDEDSNEFSDDDDIEHLLAPQEQSQNKEEKDLKADEKPKALSDRVEIFHVEMDTSKKADHPSDTEFDPFYD